MIEVYTDGACSNNQQDENHGGWAWLSVNGDEVGLMESGYLANTTNNVMEMTAVIQVLKHLGNQNIKIYSDSQYVIQGATEWRFKWKMNDWKTKKKDIANKELWILLDTLLGDFHSVEFIKVKGHSGNKFNEIVDKLAVEASRKNCKVLLDTENNVLAEQEIVLPQMRIAIAGSRGFNRETDYNYLTQVVNQILSANDIKPESYNITINSGKAEGADTLGERFARENNFAIKEFHANWDSFGKRAGEIRNELMAKDSDLVIAFWDGSSSGTKHMIHISTQLEKVVVVVNYNTDEIKVYK